MFDVAWQHRPMPIFEICTIHIQYEATAYYFHDMCKVMSMSMCRAGFLYRDAEVTDRPNAHPWCVYVLFLFCVCVDVINGRGFVLILANMPSLYQGHFSAPGHAGVHQGSQPMVASPRATSVSTSQCWQGLNASEFNRCHLSQIRQDTGEPSVHCLSGNLIP